MPRRLRLRERVFPLLRWALPPCERITLPVADIFMRLTAHFFVFILGIAVFLFNPPHRSGSRLFGPIQTENFGIFYQKRPPEVNGAYSPCCGSRLHHDAKYDRIFPKTI
jgi:hypothetical protein